MTSERQPIVTATDLAVTLGGNRVLDQVSLALRRGEVMALVGPNGAGKSTLLAALAGDISPDAGIVQLCGHDLRQLRVQQLARVRSVMLQEHRSAFAFTVRQIVLMGRSPWPAGADDQIVRAAIAMLERNYGFQPEELTFYAFGVKAKPFKDHYRALLDDLGFTAEQADTAVEEAVCAFELNSALFDDLDQYVGATRPQTG